MQEYKKIIIGKDEIIPVAERMRKEGRYLVMIHAFFNKDGEADISYDYAVDPAVESYHVIGEFEGLDVSKRLFLPEDMLETQGKGQILVMPLKELVDKNLKEEQ